MGSSMASGGVCITSRAEQAVTACPSSATAAQRRAAKGGGMAPRSRLRTAAPEKQAKKQSGPTRSLDRDRCCHRGGAARTCRLAPSVSCEREVRILKRLVQNTRQNNPQRPDILLRLAETQFEMQTALNQRVRSLR